MTNKQRTIKLAQQAKRAGYPLDKVCPTKQPYKDIFTIEYNRYQPRKSGANPVRSACGGMSYED